MRMMAFIRDTPIPYARELKQPMCPNSLISRTFKNVRIRRVPDVAVWFRTDCDEEHVTANRQMLKCRLWLGGAIPSFLSVLEEWCASFRVERRHQRIRRSPRLYPLPYGLDSNAR